MAGPNAGTNGEAPAGRFRRSQESPQRIGEKAATWINHTVRSDKGRTDTATRPPTWPPHHAR